MPIKTVWDLNVAAVVTAEIIGFELHEKKISNRCEMSQDSPLEIFLGFKFIFTALHELYYEESFFFQLKVMIRLVKYETP